MLLLLVVIGSLISGLLAAWAVRAYLPAFVTENPGIAFGLRIPSPWQEILILAALVLVLLIALRARSALARVGYGLVLGGALANVIDRFGDGRVTDYVAVGTFPVFNLPDSCITVGVLLLLVESSGILHGMQKRR